MLACCTLEFSVAIRKKETRRRVPMMAHALSERILFLFRFLFLNHSLKEGDAEAVNVGCARLGHTGSGGDAEWGGEREEGRKREEGGEREEGRKREGKRMASVVLERRRSMVILVTEHKLLYMLFKVRVRVRVREGQAKRNAYTIHYIIGLGGI